MRVMVRVRVRVRVRVSTYLDEPAVVEGHLALGKAYRVLVSRGLLRGSG